MENEAKEEITLAFGLASLSAFVFEAKAWTGHGGGAALPPRPGGRLELLGPFYFLKSEGWQGLLVD
jgi:hypothetical protein